MEREIDNKAISERIFGLLKERGITMYRICKDLNIPFGSMSNIKNGKRQWTLSLLHRISIYLNISIDYLVLGEGNKNLGEEFSYYKLCDAQNENILLKEELQKYKTTLKEITKIITKESKE